MKVLVLFLVVFTASLGLVHGKGSLLGKFSDKSPVVVIVDDSDEASAFDANSRLPPKVVTPVIIKVPDSSSRHGFESYERVPAKGQHKRRGDREEEEHHFHYVPVRPGPTPLLPPYKRWTIPQCESWNLEWARDDATLSATMKAVIQFFVAAFARNGGIAKKH